LGGSIESLRFKPYSAFVTNWIRIFHMDGGSSDDVCPYESRNPLLSDLLTHHAVSRTQTQNP
jgi:hypothetical protein